MIDAEPFICKGARLASPTLIIYETPPPLSKGILNAFNHDEQNLTFDADWLAGEKLLKQQYKLQSSLNELQADSLLLLHFTCDSRFSFSHRLCHRPQSQSALQAITVISIINTTFISLLVYCNYLILPAYSALLSVTNSILCL